MWLLENKVALKSTANPKNVQISVKDKECRLYDRPHWFLTLIENMNILYFVHFFFFVLIKRLF